MVTSTGARILDLLLDGPLTQAQIEVKLNIDDITAKVELDGLGRFVSKSGGKYTISEHARKTRESLKKVG